MWLAAACAPVGAQQIDITLGIEHDDRLAAADVLSDEDFGQTGLADAGRTQDQGVGDTLGQGHPNVLFFFNADPMQGGIATQGRYWADRIPPGLAARKVSDTAQQTTMLEPEFEGAGRTIENTGLQIAAALWGASLDEPLAVALIAPVCAAAHVAAAKPIAAVHVTR